MIKIFIIACCLAAPLAYSTQAELDLELNIPVLSGPFLPIDLRYGAFTEVVVAGFTVDAKKNRPDDQNSNPDTELLIPLARIDRSISLEDFKHTDLMVDMGAAFVSFTNNDAQVIYISSPPTERFFLYGEGKTPIPFELHIIDTHKNKQIVKAASNITSILLLNSGQVEKRKLMVLVKRSLFPTVENREGTYSGKILLTIQAVE